MDYQVKEIPGFDGKYTIDTEGVVRRKRFKKTIKILKSDLNNLGVSLNGKTYKIKYLVYITFINANFKRNRFNVRNIIFLDKDIYNFNPNNLFFLEKEHFSKKEYDLRYYHANKNTLTRKLDHKENVRKNWKKYTEEISIVYLKKRYKDTIRRKGEEDLSHLFTDKHWEIMKYKLQLKRRKNKFLRQVEKDLNLKNNYFVKFSIKKQLK